MPERKDLKKTLVIICITYMTAAMLIMPSKTMAAAENGLVLCANAVIPSVFPFIFCANMFISLGAAGLAGRYLSKIMRPLFNIPGSGAVAAAPRHYTAAGSVQRARRKECLRFAIIRVRCL